MVCPFSFTFGTYQPVFFYHEESGSHQIDHPSESI